jgi:hypothetical protein
VGNAVFPLLEDHPSLFVYALDFSAKAIELLKQHPLYASSRRCSAAVCDVTRDELPDGILRHGGELSPQNAGGACSTEPFLAWSAWQGRTCAC